jgi:hypothetical protein
VCSATHFIGNGPIHVFSTTRLPGRNEPPPSWTSTLSHGGVSRCSTPALSWNANTRSGGAAIRDSLMKRIPPPFRDIARHETGPKVTLFFRVSPINRESSRIRMQSCVLLYGTLGSRTRFGGMMFFLGKPRGEGARS